ncbi:MAG: hypothetical protein JWN98_1360 [Abditibacteriota bacterium]|nr:hypothetical protein [Abditibacteriota bacterium]
MKTGLVSITFRQLSPAQIVNLVSRAGLDGIEWGGDVHVPHGDLEKAREVRELTQQAGLEVAAYGSYYRAGESENEGLAWDKVLSTAIELGAPLIRVWAGKRGSNEANDEYRRRVEDDLKRICDMAASQSTLVALEFHGGTLTDNGDSTRALLETVNCPNLKSLWQPSNGKWKEKRRRYELNAIRPWLSNLHVFQWLEIDKDRKRRPLAEGSNEWSKYLKMAEREPGERFALLEFVRDDDPEQFLRDAATLKSWLET